MRAPVWGGLAILVVAVAIGCGGSSEDAVAKAQIAAMNEAAKVLEEVKDKAGFEAAKKKADDIMEKASKEAKEKSEKWTDDKKKEIEKKYGEELKKAGTRYAEALVKAAQK